MIDNVQKRNFNFMKKFIFTAIFMLVFAFCAFAQTTTFSDVNCDYTFELPDLTWKMVAKPTVTSPNVEYAYGDRFAGNLEVRKISAKADDLVSDLILRETDLKLQFWQGFVNGKELDFSGKLKGRVFNFEYVKNAKSMSGRFYYLRADDETVYVLRFTGLREKLLAIRNQTDSIARTFKLK
jgi:hypothetical protein